jgi:hypothetical protein
VGALRDDESFDDARAVALDWVENGVEPEG